MSKLNVDQKNVKGIFQNTKLPFLIPDYQRPYAWGTEECKTLWDDLFSFAFPNNASDQFNEEDEYFLGPIVTFKNDAKQIEIIDGQQRLTTLMLLLRAFYEKLGNMRDSNSISMKQDIEKCIWRTNDFGSYNPDDLKVISRVATDDDVEDFKMILTHGRYAHQKSRYASNFEYFRAEINRFLDEYPSYFAYFPARILNYCVMLPIEAESQDTALRIFSTLNDRGKPLSDSDIFKAQFYKYYTEQNQRAEFIDTWRRLDEMTARMFHPTSGTPLDELFTRYMYYVRAKMRNKSTTTESLRRFYEKEKYALLRQPETLGNLVKLAEFWEDVTNQDAERFSKRVLERLFVLNYSPNGMWTYILSVYFMHKKDQEGNLDEDGLYRFLSLLIGFTWAYAVTNPGVNSLRTPVYAEMLKIVMDKEVTFGDYRFERERLYTMLDTYHFSNSRAITKSMITWWAFNHPEQQVFSLDEPIDIEHIYSRNRQKQEKGLTNEQNIEKLGNKSILERRINIRASDYRFEDKKKYYKGFETARRIVKQGTKVCELKDIANNQTKFDESDIEARTEKILRGFLEYLDAYKLLK